MNRDLYKIVGWILIIVGIIATILSLYSNTYINIVYFSQGMLNNNDAFYEIGAGLLISILTLTLSLFPGRYYLKIADKKSQHNKLTNSSLILTMIGIILIVIAFFYMLIQCPPSTNICDGWGVMLIFDGIFPAAVLYGIAVILLIVNKLLNK